MNYTATYKAPLGAGKTVYGFEVEVIDLRTDVRSCGMKIKFHPNTESRRKLRRAPNHYKNL